jgi:hypothetical protein
MSSCTCPAPGPRRKRGRNRSTAGTPVAPNDPSGALYESLREEGIGEGRRPAAFADRRAGCAPHYTPLTVSGEQGAEPPAQSGSFLSRSAIPSTAPPGQSASQIIHIPVSRADDGQSRNRRDRRRRAEAGERQKRPGQERTIRAAKLFVMRSRLPRARKENFSSKVVS